MDVLTNQELLKEWDSITDPVQRDVILTELKRRNLFPSEQMHLWEEDTGSYPLADDPNFIQKLLNKREFAESFQNTVHQPPNQCDITQSFEATPVQRFVTNLMSPKSPYMSALLFHGVGVGKTCAAVLIAESWLDAFPRQKVYIVAPPTIQQGFFRNMFDVSKLTLQPEGSNKPNQISGCIGNTYLELTGMSYGQNPEKIERTVMKQIHRRYNVFGYISFANYVRDLMNKSVPIGMTDSKKIEQLQYTAIRKEFSGKLLIVDESHNLRDVGDEGADIDENTSEGKQLTPFLKKVLLGAEGLKLVLMTATPMYNSYREIIFMLNLLLLNDKKAPITESDIFESNGTLKASGQSILGLVANHYISFMRGENPISFPIRLHPMNTGLQSLTTYPSNSPKGARIAGEETEFVKHLPLVYIPLSGDTLNASLAFISLLSKDGGGISSIQLEKIVHAGNFIVPPLNDAEQGIESYRRRTEADGFTTFFSRDFSGKEVHYKPREGRDVGWLGLERLGTYSPKFAYFIRRIAFSEGVVLCYTRFVNMGAVPIALALEANGYTPHGRKTRMLTGSGAITPGGRQCAVCPKREHAHNETEKGHFKPAFYGIITGDSQLSPDNESLIRASRDLGNADGIKIKVLVGSQIAAEGIDLKFIREIHIMDSWFHLNKIEQIFGRGIRFCSHAALPKEKRNLTPYLYTAVLPQELQMESADLYSYRVAFHKAVQIGNVTRVLKTNAIDCNLNRNAVLISGQGPVMQIDSQRNVRENVNINDTPFTAVCDWIESCPYKCKPEIAVRVMDTDDSTYDEFSARWRLKALQDRFRALFSEQLMYRDDDFHTLFDDVPKIIKAELFSSVVDNKEFKVQYQGKDGYIHYCNTYYIFQPFAFQDTSIPLAIRMAHFPVKRDSFTPVKIEPVVVEEPEIVSEPTVSVVGVWNRLVEWCSAIAVSTAYIAPPELYHIAEFPEKYTKDVRSKYEYFKDAVQWLFGFYVASPHKSQAAFRSMLMKYYWDKWFTTEEQIKIVYSADAVSVEEVIGDAVYMFGTLKVHRFQDPGTGKLVFMCAGEPCQQSIINDIQRDSKDPIKKSVITTETTAPLYGFIVPKKGNIFVFKTSEPPEPGNKIARGSECANVSNIDVHIGKLVQLGNYMKNIGLDEMGLSVANITMTKKGLTNATRVCSLMELVLRYMDATLIGNKRWFYRPIASYYAGHKGTTSG